ncbi:major histocompatibility complex class I-related gene protein-like isoform X2 [Hemicordylus capensis]|nr:major histocompatibility complex class I-related gene protein-like isoform X2 [Hemicordylus capensis]
MRKSERRFSGDLETLQKHYNQSRGLYTWQHMYGCELGKNGQIRAYSQYSYSGRDFLSFDKETLTWTATDATAQIFKRKYDDNLEYSQYVKDYQEGICINQLKKFLEDGKKSLLKREPPTAKVTRKEGYDGLEIFTCRAHGFYPKEIDINWKKDGEVWLQDTFHGGVSPNSDGTYHTWLSIEIDPREKDHYQCHVEHDGLPEPLVLTYREPGGSSHSMHHSYTAVWEPGQGRPHFMAVQYMDDQLMVRYDNITKKAMPQVSWMGNGSYLARSTMVMQTAERRLRGDLETLKKLYNQSRGFYTWQHMCRCELSKKGQIRAYSQYSYNGKDFLNFDKEMLTWTATDATAQIFKRQYDANLDYSHRVKAYLEVICISRLQKFLEDGKETLLRKEPPTVTLTQKTGYGGLEVFTCQAYGFYPKEIDINWKKDGEVWLQDTFHGGVTPNSDGTYHTWLSIETDPREKDHYQCHVEHDGLPEPLVLTYREPASMPIMRHIVGITVGVGVILIGAAGIFIYMKMAI